MACRAWHVIQSIYQSVLRTDALPSASQTVNSEGLRASAVMEGTHSASTNICPLLFWTKNTLNHESGQFIRLNGQGLRSASVTSIFRSRRRLSKQSLHRVSCSFAIPRQILSCSIGARQSRLDRTDHDRGRLLWAVYHPAISKGINITPSRALMKRNAPSSNLVCVMPPILLITMKLEGNC